MANTKISQAYEKPVLEPTDMIPVAKQGALTPYHVTGQTVFDSLPPASAASQGVVELATAAETKAGTDTERAVTPASLVGAIGPTMLAAGVHWIGAVTELTAVAICNQFEAAMGREVEYADMMIFEDYAAGFYFGFYHEAAGKIYGFNLRNGSFINIS